MAFEDRYVTATPEAVHLDLRLAGLGSRAGAAAIDYVLLYIALFVVEYVTGLIIGSGGQTAGWLAIGFQAVFDFLLVFGYFIASEVLWSGKTLGKRALGIRVVRLDGTAVGFGPSLVRNLFRLLIPLYIVDVIMIAAGRRNQRVGDLVAGTLVVRDRLGAMQGVSTMAWHDPRLWGGPVYYPGAAPQWSQSGPMPGMPTTPPGPTGWAPPPLPPALASWDATAVTAQEIAVVRAFLGRRAAYTPEARAHLATDLANWLAPKVVHASGPMHPEQFLESLALVKAYRG